MAGSVNKAIIVGNLGKDPEFRSFPDGKRVCNLSIATSETWKDKATGDRKEKSEWHRIAIFNDGIIGVAERYLKKGAKVYIEGQLETRKYQDQQGQDRYTTEIVLRPFRGELTMLSGAPGDRNEQQEAATSAPPQAQPQPAERGAASRGTIYGEARITDQPTPSHHDLDDEIPF